MSNPGNHHKINYIEFHTTDIERARKFYGTVFGWTFVDYGPEYVSFQGAGIDGGFVKSAAHDGPGKFAPLVVLYSSDLAARRWRRGRAHLQISRRPPLPLL